MLGYSNIQKMKITRGFGLLENYLAKQRYKLANQFLSPLANKGRILDIGCGITPFFLLQLNFNEKYGLDQDVTNNQILPGIRLLKINLETSGRLPFNGQFFDAVTMLAVLEHLEAKKLRGILTEINRILKPGGRFILTTPPPWADQLLRIMAALKLVSSKEIEEHKGAYRRSKLIHFLTSAGFERKKINYGYFEMRLNSWVSIDK